MASKSGGFRPATAPAEDLVSMLAIVAAMNVDQLRARWRETLTSDPPPAFSKDLLARAICYRLQEDALGGLSPSTARLLRSLLKPGAEPPRQIKVGSVIIREHQGVVHEVLVVPHGFSWQGKTYDSLSSIAKKITGTSWNGPRFFGLRSKRPDANQSNPRAHKAPEAVSRPAGRRSSMRSNLRAGGAG